VAFNSATLPLMDSPFTVCEWLELALAVLACAAVMILAKRFVGLAIALWRR
jgi:hypothetical protein